ncbi:catalase/peroxidase [Glaciecola punicea ACAM 611]|jgi:catalase-peroxidase|uniref:Catalase-peroxidase n=1 Tax=Glaciecola punicea ACAM 611 TaxID=1121923 RepID=H5T878_9ALTE|nr:catalase/peroxidase HPI [Glaciecola punicea]GAB54519.1 catalase/peroxidase [Glaciecola punicea ACAM 611]
MSKPSKCPIAGGYEAIESKRIGGAIGTPPMNADWWPGQLPIELLHSQSAKANPLGDNFDYPAAFASIDIDVVKKDIAELLITSQDFWPADYGNYGPQMIRMAWHSAGSYRVFDGRGGSAQGLQRFAPLYSWEDNGNIDKSIRLLQPIKLKYGENISWADLIILTGNVALEQMGFKTFGFGGGRIDCYEADDASYWGPETVMATQDKRWLGEPGTKEYDLENPLAASRQSLIYVHPEGPFGNMDPLSSAQEIRITFGRMGMNDAETVALIAGGHAFGKSHGGSPKSFLGPEPSAAPIENQALGWLNSNGSGKAQFTTTNGIEGAWTSNPTRWDHEYLKNLFAFDWEQCESVAGGKSWRPKEGAASDLIPDAHVEGLRHPPMMMTTDIALIKDPAYLEVCKKFFETPALLDDAFAKAWYKLIHRDMGPKNRLLGKDVPSEELIWQDPIPELNHDLISEADINALKTKILETGHSVSALVSTAWGSASTFRKTDLRGGANGARIRLEPMINWEVNNPKQLKSVLASLEEIQQGFNSADSGAKRVSVADLVVLSGCAAIEKAALSAGVKINVPFVPGRMDALKEQTDEHNISFLEPYADGFRNFTKGKYAVDTERMLIDRAHLLDLSAPEMTALVGGLRVLDTNFDGSKHGVFTTVPGALSNDFFVNLLDINTKWAPIDEDNETFEGKDTKTGELKWTATRNDLVFGSNLQLRAVCEVYGSSTGNTRFITAFVSAWHKVMMLDRFELENELYRS